MVRKAFGWGGKASAKLTYAELIGQRRRPQAIQQSTSSFAGQIWRAAPPTCGLSLTPPPADGSPPSNDASPNWTGRSGVGTAAQPPLARRSRSERVAAPAGRRSAVLVEWAEAGGGRRRPRTFAGGWRSRPTPARPAKSSAAARSQERHRHHPPGRRRDRVAGSMRCAAHGLRWTSAAASSAILMDPQPGDEAAPRARR